MNRSSRPPFRIVHKQDRLVTPSDSPKEKIVSSPLKDRWNTRSSRRAFRCEASVAGFFFGWHTMWVASPWGFSETTIQPPRHKYHASCLLRAEFLAFQPVLDNTRGTRVEQVVSSFQKILRGSQLTWYSPLWQLPRSLYDFDYNSPKDAP